MPAKIFVSYSRKDKAWLRKFQAALGGGVYEQTFELWTDESIAAGDTWSPAIEDALAGSRFALLLVSMDYVRSKYIVQHELPNILARRDEGGVTVLWIPLKTVPTDLLKKVGLDPIQAFWPPKRPLHGLQKNRDKLDDALTQIASKLTRRIELEDNTSKALRDELRPKVAEVIGSHYTVYGEPFAAGDYSIFYRAKQRGDEVAVKALVSLPSREWLGTDFIERARIVRQIKSGTAIPIRDIFPDQRVPCVVMDHIDAPTLRSRLEKEGKLLPRLVAEVLAQLVKVAAELHGLNGQPVLGPIRPSHVHYDSALKRAFISLLPIANETLTSCREHPTWLQDTKALPYLSPERFYGRPLDKRADQYHLGLLGLELLNGTPPVQVAKFSDLEQKVKLFESPWSAFGRDFRKNEPAFSFVLARLLRSDPQARWATSRELIDALEDIAAGRVPEVVKQHAYDQYGPRLNNSDFVRAFYETLFAKSPDVRALFSPNMEVQYQKFRDALRNIIEFTRNRVGDFGDQVGKHSVRGIKPEHFGAFRDAFLASLPAVGVVDEDSQDAWRAVLDPALAYMKDKIAELRP